MVSVTTTYDYEGSPGAAATQTSAESSATPSSGVTHQSSMGVHGGTGLQFQCTTTSTPLVTHNATQPTNPFVAHRQQELRAAIFLPTGGPGVDNTTLGQWYGAIDGTTTIARVQLKTSGALVVTDTGSAHTLTIKADVSAYYGIALGIHFLVDTGDTNANASVKARLHSDPNDPFGTLISGTDVSATNFNLGSAAGVSYPMTQARWGIATTQGVVKTLGLDYFQIKSESTAYSLNGPPAATQPTAVITAPTTTFNGLVGTFNYSAASSTAGTGTITAWEWTVIFFPAGAPSPSLSAPAGSSGSFTAAHGQTKIQLRVRNSSLVWSDPVTKTYYAYPASNAEVGVQKAPDPLTVTSTWTNEGGATDLATAWNDSSNATAGKSPASPVNEPVAGRMKPYGPGSIDLNVAGVAIGGSINRTIRMFKNDGVTTIGTLGPFALPVISEVNAANPTLLAAAISIATLSIDSTGLAAVPTDVDRQELIFTITDNAV